MGAEQLRAKNKNEIQPIFRSPVSFVAIFLKINERVHENSAASNPYTQALRIKAACLHISTRTVCVRVCVRGARVLCYVCYRRNTRFRLFLCARRVRVMHMSVTFTCHTTSCARVCACIHIAPKSAASAVVKSQRNKRKWTCIQHITHHLDCERTQNTHRKA